MSNKTSRGEKVRRMKQNRRIWKIQDKVRKAAAAELEMSDFTRRLNRERILRSLFMYLFILSIAVNIWQFVRLM